MKMTSIPCFINVRVTLCSCMQWRNRFHDENEGCEICGESEVLILEHLLLEPRMWCTGGGENGVPAEEVLLYGVEDGSHTHKCRTL